MSFLAVNLKMYFDLRETLDWCSEVRDVAARDEGVSAGRTELVVFPSAPAVISVVQCFERTPVKVGAQDISEHDVGPYTGELSATMFAEAGASYAEVGHAERRQAHGETDTTVALKAAAAWRNGLVPLICVGEPVRQPSDEAARFCTRQLRTALGGAADSPDNPRRVVVAYEPVWAIGADRPASSEHVRAVCKKLRALLDEFCSVTGIVVYGGSAGPGLLDELAGNVDGLFLGRFAHAAGSLRAVLHEAGRCHASDHSGIESSGAGRSAGRDSPVVRKELRCAN